MAVNLLGAKNAYGLQNALQSLATPPIISLRAPTSNDFGAPLGTVWVYIPGQMFYVLTSNTGGSAVWTNQSTQQINAIVTHAATPYTATATDSFIQVDTTGGVVTVNLPNAPVTGRSYIIKDTGGDASVNNITITTVGGSVNIDGGTSATISTNYGFLQLVFNGTKYLSY